MITTNPLNNPQSPGKMNQEVQATSTSATDNNRELTGNEKSTSFSGFETIFSDLSKPFELPDETANTGWPEL